MENYVLITGASSGIGRAIAVTLSKTYPLILGGRNVERLEETRAMCADSDKHIFWNFDLSDVENIYENLKAFIKEGNLKIGGFVHSAGITYQSTLNLSDINFAHKLMDINFFSATEILKVLVTKKINGKNLKAVVFISSIASIRGTRGESFYAASKGAIDSFARVMAVDLAPNVRVNTIQPGLIWTSMTKKLGERFNSLNKHCLLGECEVQDVADTAEFLMSEKSRRITGQNFVLDGGLTLSVPSPFDA